MVSREVYLALDSRAPERIQPRGREYSQATTARVQEEFRRRNRLATTNVCCLIASVLLIRMLFFVDQWLMLAIVILGICTALSIYKSFCKCPNCNAALDHASSTGIAMVQGFGTEKCPRCEIKLNEPNQKYIPAR